MYESLVPAPAAGDEPERALSSVRPTLFSAAVEEHLQAWITSRIRAEVKREKLWEPLFVSVALVGWGWYIFWFLRALQEYTIVPWP